MKRFVEFIAEERKKQEKIPVIHVHYRSGKDPKHDIDSKETTEILIHAHYRSGKDPKHDIENKNPIKENFDPNKITGSTWSIKKGNQFENQFEHQHKHLKEQIKKHKSDRFLDSIYDYTASSHRLNKALSEGENLENLEKDPEIINLDRFTNHPKNALKKSLKVYSGISTKRGNDILNLKPGRLVQTKSYWSTTGDPEIAANFAHTGASSSSGQQARHVLQIHLPKGYTKARHIPDTVGESGLHENPGESEVLLARNQKFKKIKTRTVEDKHGNTWHIHHLEPVD